MPELNIPRGYTDGEALLEADLDNIKTAVTTLNNTTKYDGDNIQPNAITAAKIINGTITEAVLGDGSVTTNKIDDLDVTTAKIADEAIETRTMADSAVTTAKLADTNVTTAKFDTTARLASSKIAAKSVFSGTKSTPTSYAAGDPVSTLISVVAGADARYCLFMLQPYDSSSAYVKLESSSSYTASISILFKKNGSTLATRTCSFIGSQYIDAHYISIPISAFSFLYNTATISSGDTLTVDVSVASTGSATAEITACKLYIIEL